MEELFGFVESIVFSHAENGFVVARFKTPKQKELITIVGTLPSVHAGETLCCRGHWRHHPQHGKQFEVVEFEWKTPSDAKAIQKYLESGMIRGIGPVYAKKIVERFGTDTLQVIEETPDRLTEIEGIGPKRIEGIVACWQEQRQVRAVMLFLRGHGVSPAYAQKIFRQYGEQSVAKVQENPYRLAREVRGIGFASADKIAKELGFAHTSPQRLEAGLEFVLWDAMQEGHTCLPRVELLQRAAKVLESEETALEAPLANLIDSKIFFAEDELVWTKMLYLCEKSIVREWARLRSRCCTLRSVHIEKAVAWAEERLHLQLAKEQREAVAAGVTDKIAILTGGPGTGKSTITKAILAISSQLSPKILLAAPTGRAAKRLSEITRRKTFTIHSLLEMDFASGGFKRGKENPLDCDLLVIDEASMIDTLLLHSLLKAIPDQARVLLIGDVDQLPSVGAGSILADLISSERLPVYRLRKIFRQAAGSRIVVNAHRVNEGIFPEIDPAKETDFAFIECDDPAQIAQRIVSLVTTELPQKYSFHPLQDIQVLSPMKRGIVGIEHLNQVLQEGLNPVPNGWTRGGEAFRPGDKVMQIRNNYNKEVYNGDIGRIQRIDSVEQQVLVLFDDREVSYEFHELEELVLAYAVSVHKYQGSECPCIVMPVHTSHFKLLQRNLLYTGITRGKRRVVLIGSKKAIAMAIHNDEGLQRHTGLRRFLERELPPAHHPLVAPPPEASAQLELLPHLT